MTKRTMRKFFLAVLGVGLVGCAGIWSLNRPASIEYLRQHPDAFNLHHYHSAKEIEDTLNTIFPIGTARSSIDLVLADALNMAYSDPEPADTDGYVIDYVKRENGIHTAGTSNWRNIAFSEYWIVITAHLTNDDFVRRPFEVYFAGVPGAPKLGYRKLQHNMENN